MKELASKIFSRDIYIYIYIVLTLFALNFFHFSNVFAVSYQNNITTGFTINESISITISNDNISINNLLPGQYADSNTIDVSVVTNSAYGYTLTATVGNTSHNNRNLTHTTKNDENFTSLDINSETTSLSDFNDDKWGYSISQDNGTNWTSYSGLPLYTDNNNVAVLKETKILSNDNNKVTFKIGAKASNNKTSGTYENVINFTVVGNPKHLFMQDIDTWRDTLVSTGDAIMAVDIRDGKEYWVGRQADGKIWMTQNLDFEITSTPLTSDTTDLVAYGAGTGYEASAGYTKEGDTIKWTPANTAITSNVVVPVSTATGEISGLTGWADNNYTPYSAEGGDVYVYTSNTTDPDIIYTSLSSCIAASHTEAECKHYHRGNYYNWSAVIANNNTNVTELTTNYNTASNSICPAGWKLPVGAKAEVFSQVNTEFAYLLKQSNIFSDYPVVITSSVSYTTNGFSNIRSNPLLFVRGGNVHGTSLYGSGMGELYWSSSVGGISNAYYLTLSSSYFNPAANGGRYGGFSIRCVARDPIYYMQDVAKWENKIPNTGDEITVVDKRDNKEYTVARQADGNIWMTQNLDFEITGETLTSDTTDLVAYGEDTGYTNDAGYSKLNDIIQWTPAATAKTSNVIVPVSATTGTVGGLLGWDSNYYNPYSAEGGDVYVYTSYSDDNDTIYTSLSSCIAASHTEAECKHYHRGDYYNWSAAVASNNTNVTKLNKRSNTTQNSICPAGWKLPVGARADTFSPFDTEYANLLKESGIINGYVEDNVVDDTDYEYATDGFYNIRSNPLFFIRAGNLSAVNGTLNASGVSGYYWSSSTYDSYSAYIMSFRQNYTKLALDATRAAGRSIRCVARKTYYMQDVDEWENQISSTGDALVAVDKRDEKEYWVGRQADGKIWMTQNLDFEITGETLTSETSDLIAYNTGGYTSAAGYTQENGTIKWTPASTAITANSVVPVSTSTGTVSGLTGWSADYSGPSSAEGGDVYVYTSNSTSSDIIYTSLSSCVAASHTEAECKHYHRGNYYNWNAAVAHNNTLGTEELTTQYNTAQNSICPAGWRLPVGVKADTFSQTNTEFAHLLKQSSIISDYPSSTDEWSYAPYTSNGFNDIRSNPIFFVRGGGIVTDGDSLESSGVAGYYWSSSVNDLVVAYRLSILPDAAYPTYAFINSYGGSIRCVAR